MKYVIFAMAVLLVICIIVILIKSKQCNTYIEYNITLKEKLQISKEVLSGLEDKVGELNTKINTKEEWEKIACIVCPDIEGRIVAYKKEQKEIKDKSIAEAVSTLITDTIKNKSKDKNDRYFSLNYALERYEKLSVEQKSYIDHDLIKRLRKLYNNEKKLNDLNKSSDNSSHDAYIKGCQNAIDHMLTWTPPPIL